MFETFISPFQEFAQEKCMVDAQRKFEKKKNQLLFGYGWVLRSGKLIWYCFICWGVMGSRCIQPLAYLWLFIYGWVMTIRGIGAALDVWTW